MCKRAANLTIKYIHMYPVLTPPDREFWRLQTLPFREKRVPGNASVGCSNEDMYRETMDPSTE